MNTNLMAAGYMEWARLAIEDARAGLAKSCWWYAYRRAHEVIELASKALLRAMAIEFPKVHDAAPGLLALRDMMPAATHADIERLATLMQNMTPYRGPAMYGIEKDGIPPSDLFDEPRGRRAVEDAEWALRTCEALIAAAQGETPSDGST